MEILSVPSPLPVVVSDELSAGRVHDVYNDLKRINGVGPKIASLVLRDVALYCEHQLTDDRHLLQPVDIWVRRATEMAAGRTFGDGGMRVARLIVQMAGECGVWPEHVNAGMWYFGAEVATSEYMLRKAIESPSLVRELMDQHVDARKRGIAQWERSSSTPAGEVPSVAPAP